MRRFLLIVVTALALMTALPALALAATTVQVNTEADNAAAAGECSGATGDCSIRQAIDIAQDGDTVAIPFGHYVVDPAQKAIFVDRDITIQGTGNPVIDGNDKIGVFSIGDNGNTFTFSAPTVTMSGLTITGGHDEVNGGGGIVVYGALTLIDSTVVGNRSAYTGGGIEVTPPGEGGGSSLRLENSTVSGNHANDDVFEGGGGGIDNHFGSVVVVQSTIVGNSAGDAADGQNHRGGGIFSSSSNGGLAIYSSTITGNSVTGAAGSGGNIYAEDTSVTSFFARARAAAGPLGDVNLQNTIVADGIAPDGPNCGGATPASHGNNAVPAGQCGMTPALGDVGGDPKLGPLANNGGNTLTRKLLPGSAAINAGDPTGCKDDQLKAISPDQRTQPRPQGSACDIGAVEFAPPVAVTDDPADVTAASATINGHVSNPLIKAGTAHFEFGTSTAYGQTFDAGTMASGASNDPRSLGVTNLSGGTTYHYRIVAQNDDDTAIGADKQFTTPGEPPPPGTPTPTPTPVPPPNTPNAPKPKPHKPTVRAARAGAGCVRSRFSARLSITVASSSKLRSVQVLVDGKRVMKTTRRRFSVHINARRLHAGSHVLRVIATDSAGRKTALQRVFRRCLPPTQPAFTG